MNRLRTLLSNSECILTIAEIGINHDGNLSTAKQLIGDAAWAGANAIKFQYRNLKNIYDGELLEIGDEIISSEINRNFIQPSDIIELARVAVASNLLVGISFFCAEDVKDFSSDLHIFDFFKVPSVEMMNLDLIEKLIQNNLPILISTGAHTESQILQVLEIFKGKDIIPMHCVSNYPTMEFNSNLGYIAHLKKTWGGLVGFSSHDSDWKTAILAISLGARVIERHLTLSKSAVGLDHSTSSTKEEFRELIDFVVKIPELMRGDGPRYPNQGELINLQNLGRSFYAKKFLAPGDLLKKSDFNYRAPRIGISWDKLSDHIEKPIRKSLKPGEVLTISHLCDEDKLLPQARHIADDLEIALPVRIHDFSQIHDKFNLNHYELHLSFQELNRLTDFKFIPKIKGLSVHLPDYVNSTNLIDPFSANLEVQMMSQEMLSKIISIVQREQELRRIKIPIVGSFSVGGSKDDFYSNHFRLQDEFRKNGVELLFQWLPPFAWYFGGATRLHSFNDTQAVSLLKRQMKNICLDISHFKLGVGLWGLELDSLFDELLTLATHFHISDAAGLDGEGLAFGEGEGDVRKYLDKVVPQSGVKVIEVWQGHLNNFAGFTKALNYISSTYGK